MVEIEVGEIFASKNLLNVEGKDPGKEYLFSLEGEVEAYRRMGYEISKDKKLKLLEPDGDQTDGVITRRADERGREKLVLMEIPAEKFGEIQHKRAAHNNGLTDGYSSRETLEKEMVRLGVPKKYAASARKA